MLYGDSAPILSPDQTVNTSGSRAAIDAMQKALGFGNIGKFLVVIGIGLAAWFVFRTKEK